MYIHVYNYLLYIAILMSIINVFSLSSFLSTLEFLRLVKKFSQNMYIIDEWHTFDIGNSGSSGTPGRYPNSDGENNAHYRPGISQVPVQNNRPVYGNYGGSQSSANANANAKAGNSRAPSLNPSGPHYTISSEPKVTGNANANAQASAIANAAVNSGIHIIPNKYPEKGVAQLEIIPINVQPVSRPTSTVVRPVPQRPHSRPIPQGGEVVIPIVVVEESPATQHPPHYHRPNFPHHHRPSYGGNRKEQPIEIIVIEEPASNQGDTLWSRIFVIIDSLGCTNWWPRIISVLSSYNPSWKQRWLYHNQT